MFKKHIYKGVPLGNVLYIIISQREDALFPYLGGNRNE